MDKSEAVMNEFMQKLKANWFKKDNQPNHGPQITKEYVDSERKAYKSFLRSGILE